jgi:hypothetical protein
VGSRILQSVIGKAKAAAPALLVAVHQGIAAGDQVRFVGIIPADEPDMHLSVRSAVHQKTGLTLLAATHSETPIPT